MRSINKITIVGNVGSDPKKIETKKGDMASFSVATSRKWKDGDGGDHEETQWHRCIAFGPVAKIALDYVKKGSPLYVEGEMRYSKYQNDDGVEVPTADVRIRDLVLLPSGKGKAPEGGSYDGEDVVPF